MSKRGLRRIFLVLIALPPGAVGTAGETPASQASKATRPPAEQGQTQTPTQENPEPEYRTESVRGKVVWLGEALQERFGISTVPESHRRGLAIYTEEGELLPLAEDIRGRSFRTDERLRGKPLELFVRRCDKHPLLQVIRVYEFQDGKKYELDYWCDVCAITMFEKGLCACCQDENRLRRRIVD